MAEVAKKRDPKKWAAAKAKARKRLGGHSARAMQLLLSTTKKREDGTRVKSPVKINYGSGVRKIGKLVKNTKKAKNLSYG